MEVREFFKAYREFCDHHLCGGNICPIFDECTKFTAPARLKDEHIDKLIETIMPQEEGEKEEE